MIRDPQSNLAAFGEISTAIDPALHFGAGVVWTILAVIFLAAIVMCSD